MPPKGRPGHRGESDAGRRRSPSDSRSGGAAAAAHSRRRGSPASAGCPQRPERCAGPCGSVGWDECRRRPAAMRRRRLESTETQMRRSDAGEPSGSSVRRAATAPGRREPSGVTRHLDVFPSECPTPLPEVPLAPRAAADGSASAGRPERRGEPMDSERRWGRGRHRSRHGECEGRDASGEWPRRREWCASSTVTTGRLRPAPQRLGERLRQHVPPRDAGVDSWAAGSRGKPPGGCCDREVVAAGGPAVTTWRLPGRQPGLYSVKTVAGSCRSCQENQHTFV